jgi:uncharacterized protein YecE (DUF72 family)
MRPQDIDIGTSGWKFDDWAGSFYPLRVPQNKWLEYYAARFPIGEINSTYYRIASAKSYAGMLRKTPENFRFVAKVHAEVTHGRNEPKESLRQLLSALEPLRESGRLIGLLAQFPASFRCTPKAADYVLRLRSAAEEASICIEFRSGTWLNEAAVEQIRAAGMTWVCPDEPDLPDLMPYRLIATSDLLYVRFHGRNVRAWYDRSAGDRYNYEYSKEELTDFGRELLAFETPIRRALILFNNCHAGQAPRNAWWLKSWLEAMSGGQNQFSVDEINLSTD